MYSLPKSVKKIIFRISIFVFIVSILLSCFLPMLDQYIQFSSRVYVFIFFCFLTSALLLYAVYVERRNGEVKERIKEGIIIEKSVNIGRSDIKYCITIEATLRNYPTKKVIDVSIADFEKYNIGDYFQVEETMTEELKETTELIETSTKEVDGFMLTMELYHKEQNALILSIEIYRLLLKMQEQKNSTKYRTLENMAFKIFIEQGKLKIKDIESFMLFLSAVDTSEMSEISARTNRAMNRATNEKDLLLLFRCLQRDIINHK